MKTQLSTTWRPVLGQQFRESYFVALNEFVDRERREHLVYPPEAEVFNAFKLTPLDAVKVVILGQDPYHDDDQAHGLAFSVRSGVKPPPSLRNIFKELATDLGCPKPTSGDLTTWAKQGVLLLNTVLTVRAHQPHSHRGKGWEKFTDAAIAAVAGKGEPVIFVLWGAPAQKKSALIDPARHKILKAPHPSPLSAHSGFFGSKPFSAVNAALKTAGSKPIEWCLS